MKGEKLLLLRRLFSATVLGTGFGVIWLIGVAVLGTIVLQKYFREEPVAREKIEVRADGTPLIEMRRGHEVEGYRDLDGRPIVVAGQPVLIQPVMLTGSEDVEGIEYFFRWGRIDWDWRLKAFEDDQHQSNHWYFVHNGRENGAGYFVGYNWANNQRIGFIGESGFSPAGSIAWACVRSRRLGSCPCFLSRPGSTPINTGTTRTGMPIRSRQVRMADSQRTQDDRSSASRLSKTTAPAHDNRAASILLANGSPARMHGWSRQA